MIFEISTGAHTNCACTAFSLYVLLHPGPSEKVLFSASILVEPACSKNSAAANCFLNSSGIKILSPANSKPNRLVTSVKIGRDFLGARSVWLFRRQFFSCSSFGPTEVLWIGIFNSTVNLISTLLNV